MNNVSYQTKCLQYEFAGNDFYISEAKGFVFYIQFIFKDTNMLRKFLLANNNLSKYIKKGNGIAGRESKAQAYQLLLKNEQAQVN